MKPLIRSTAAAATAVLAVLATAPALALAEGEQYLSISKGMACEGTACSATIKGRKNKQTVITHITCLSFANEASVAFGAATDVPGSQVTLAILPVQSRTLVGTVENAVVGGPTQIVLGPDDSFFFGVIANGPIQQAVCTLTGTTTKQ